MPLRRTVAAIWLLAIVHGTFYIVLTPLWEGFDEPFHYAYIQELAERGRIPVHGETRISEEITASFHLLPLSPAVNANLGGRYTDFGAYFGLPEPARREREQALRRIPAAARRVPDTSGLGVYNYEAQHPPLYYAAAVPVYRAFQRCDLPTRIFALRAFSLLIGSMTVLLAYGTARLLYSDPRRLLCFPLLVALLPMFFSTVARISNDCLGVTLYSLLFFLVLKSIAGGWPRSHAICSGIVMGLGLLTKAYFLTALPAVACVYLASGLRRRSLGPAFRRLGWTLLIGLLVAGGWYARNYYLYGTVSGLFVLAEENPTPLGEQLKTILEIPWLSGIHVIFREQLWTGNSSFFGIARIYYQLGYALFGLAAAGMVVFFAAGPSRSRTVFAGSPLKRNARVPEAAPLAGSVPGYGAAAVVCFFFVLGMLYQIHQTYVATGQVVTGGWYLYAVVIPELLLLDKGLGTLAGGGRGRVLVPSVLVAGACGVNFLGYFCKAVPYYTGFRIPRFNPKHLFEVYSWEGFLQVTENLALNKPPGVTPACVGAVIGAYVAVLLAVLVLWALSGRGYRARESPGA